MPSATRSSPASPVRSRSSFPQQVVTTAVALAELHALTEELDQAMALVWLAQEGDETSDARRYALAWREVGRREDREDQLTVVLRIGEEMARLTRTAGLRVMLRMMRGPATAAGLGSLQRFLESGFDTFAAMAKRPGGAEQFLRHHRNARVGLAQDAVRHGACRLRDGLGPHLRTSPLTLGADSFDNRGAKEF